MYVWPGVYETHICIIAGEKLVSSYVLQLGLLFLEKAWSMHGLCKVQLLEDLLICCREHDEMCFHSRQ